MNRIKELLARNGLKVKWVAEQIDCHPTEVSQWIAGRRTPSLPRAIKIANLLGCTVEYLFPTIKHKQGEIDVNTNKEKTQVAGI